MGKVVTWSLVIILGVGLSAIGFFTEDPVSIIGGVLWLLAGIIHARERRMERKIQELHERIDRLASKIR